MSPLIKPWSVESSAQWPLLRPFAHRLGSWAYDHVLDAEAWGYIIDPLPEVHFGTQILRCLQVRVRKRYRTISMLSTTARDGTSNSASRLDLTGLAKHGSIYGFDETSGFLGEDAPGLSSYAPDTGDVISYQI